MTLTCKLSAVCLAVLSGFFFAIPPTQAKAPSDRVLIASIEVLGLTRTLPSVVLRELTFGQGDWVSPAELEESLQRIRNTLLFSLVKHQLIASADADRGAALTIEVEERWTTIPIFKLSAGGGTLKFTAGAYDVNAFGRYLEVGGQYERLGNENSGVVWLRQPRLLGQRLELFVSLWDITRAETIYRDLGRSGEVEGGLLLRRQRASLSLEKEWTRWLRAGLLADYNRDRCDPNLLATDDETQRSAILADHKQMTTAVLPGLSVRLGRLNHNVFLTDGVLLDHRSQMSSAALGATDSFHINETSLQGFMTGPKRSTFALRGGIGWTNTQVTQYYFFLGGLDRIRGYEAGRFYGTGYWLINAEARLPLTERPHFVLQGAAFSDAASVGMARSDLEHVTAASAGVGLRVIAPKIYRLVLRMDYAHGLVSKTTQPLSFGIQQFF